MFISTSSGGGKMRQVLDRVGGLQTPFRIGNRFGNSAYQNYNTFKETDGPGKVTVTKNQIILTDGDRDEDYYVTKQFPSGYFGDFTHWVDVNVTAITADGNSSFYFDAVTNADDDLYDIDAALGDCIFLGVG